MKEGRRGRKEREGHIKRRRFLALSQPSICPRPVTRAGQMLSCGAVGATPAARPRNSGRLKSFPLRQNEEQQQGCRKKNMHFVSYPRPRL